MTKEEIQKNSEHWYNKYKDAEKQITELEEKLEQTEKDLTDYQFNYPTIKELEKENKSLGERCLQLQKDKGNLTDEVRKLKILVSSLVYEINQIWDINEMNDDLRMCAEKIDREVQLSKMAEDNRVVISALGFAVVPPKPKLDVKEV